MYDGLASGRIFLLFHTGGNRVAISEPAFQLIPTEQFIKMARQQGIEINHRTLRLYASQGLLPHAVVRNLPSGGRSGFYPRDVLQTLFLIALLKERGHTLKEIQGMLDRLEEVARQRAVPTTVVHAELAMSLEGGAENTVLARKDYWRPISRLVAEELIRRGRRAGQEDIEAIELVVHLRDSIEELPVLLYLSLDRVDFRRPRPEDRLRLREFVPDSWGGALDDGLVAEWSGQPIGFGALAPEGLVHRPGHLAVTGPFVRPGYRSQGIGSRLLESLASMARARGALWLEASLSTDAPSHGAFFAERGFAPAGPYWQVVHTLERVPNVNLPPGYEVRPYGGPVDSDHLAALGRRLGRADGEAWLTASDIARLDEEPLFRDWVARLNLVLRGETPVGLLWLSAAGHGLVELVPEEMGGEIYEAMLGLLIVEAARRRTGELKARIADGGHDAFNRAAALGFEIEPHMLRFERRLA